MDNTTINLSTVVGGDVIRDLARQGGAVKTQVIQLDIGGSAANAEVLITAGQQVMAASVPVVLASNQPAIPVAGSFYPATQPVSIATLPLPAGASTEATLATLNPYRGASSYSAGAAGTVVVASGARVVSLSAHSTTGGTITIFSGAAIVVPAGNGFTDSFSGFVGPGNIVFTGTDSYYVAVNQ